MNEHLPHKFRSGDKIVCVEPFQTDFHGLSYGHVYTVCKADPPDAPDRYTYVSVVKCDVQHKYACTWLANRFTPYVEITSEDIATAKPLPSSDEVRKALL